MAPAAPDLGETKVEQGGEEERGKREGYEVFQLMVELAGESARLERQWLGLFICWPCRFWWQDIFSPAMLT